MTEIQVQYITNSDAWRNSALTPRGIMVHSTAAPGVSAQSFRDRWDRPGVGASVHYFVDDRDIIQCLPLNKRAGHAAGTANSTHIAFEMCEPKGMTYNSSGSVVTAYAPPAGYFAAVWDNAVGLCAKLCREYGFDPLDKKVLLCHCEGYKQGIASNHADVEHWFVKEGKNMDAFRAAVKAVLDGGAPAPEKKPEETKEEETVAKYDSLEQVPEWGRATVKKLLEKNALQGDGEKLDLSEDMLRIFVVLDRMGLYD